MSLTVSNCFQIHNSPLNLSKSKQLYSIPKAKRFQNDQKSYCSQAFYNLPEQQDKRMAGIGYGTKYDFTKGQMTTPSANQYNIKGIFQVSKEKKLGKTLGLGRENLSTGGILNSINLVSPGPGRYESQDVKSNIKYTFRQKIMYGDPFFSLSRNTPGPGQYKTPSTISLTGKYFISKYKSSGAQFINPSHSGNQKGGSVQKGNLPGPGQYHQQEMPVNGRYVQSKYKSQGGRTFSLDKSRCFSAKSLATPGPGSYRLPSEFGYYESKPYRPQTSSLRIRLQQKQQASSQQRLNTAAPTVQRGNQSNDFEPLQTQSKQVDQQQQFKTGEKKAKLDADDNNNEEKETLQQ